MNKKMISIFICMLLFATVSLAAKAGDSSQLKKSSVTAGDVYQAGGGVDWWPMNDHDLLRVGYSSSHAPNTNDLLWSYSLNKLGGVGSAIIADGKVYIAHDCPEGGGGLYCLNANNGMLIWKNPNRMINTPAVVDGKVFTGSSDDDKVYCFNAENGNFIWSFQTGQTSNVSISSPAVVDGKVYIGSGDGNVFCLNAVTGEKIWKYMTGGMISSSPAVAYGNIYIGSWDGKVYCLDAKGNEDGTTN